MKIVYRCFFPIFALLEHPGAVAGERVVQQRKLLYLEKLFASLLLGAPRVKSQLTGRIAELIDSINNSLDALESKSVHLRILQALHNLLFFVLLAVFRVGHKVRCCTWDGRQAGTGVWAQEIMAQCWLLLVHLIGDKEGKKGVCSGPVCGACGVAAVDGKDSCLLFCGGVLRGYAFSDGPPL